MSITHTPASPQPHPRIKAIPGGYAIRQMRIVESPRATCRHCDNDYVVVRNDPILGDCCAGCWLRVHCPAM